MRPHRVKCVVAGLLLLVLTGCTPQTIIIPTLTPTITKPGSSATPANPASHAGTDLSFSCADLDASWAANDWPQVLSVLQRLQKVQQTCGSEPIETKQYAAHVNYGTILEAGGQRASAIEQFRAALSINSRGREALDALSRLEALPTLSPSPCRPTEVLPYSAQPGDFVVVADRGFAFKGKPYYLRGLNYYPRHAPWEAFLTKADMTEVTHELDLIAESGFNTLRIMLWYDPLFTCTPESAIPNAPGFARLDRLISLARDRSLKLIVTLNDLPDLYFRPLYTDFARYDAQTAYIVNRYRDEPTILAWDLRNEPDLDFGADGRPAVASSEAVMKWLTHIAEVVKQNDQHHLITIGWWGNAAAGSEIVDFSSFHHWADATALAQRIKALRAASAKPIVLEEVGYPAQDQASEAAQARLLKETINTAESGGTAGWLIWTAFDFAPPFGQAPDQEHSFGLWHTDLTPKLALNVLPLHTQP